MKRIILVFMIFTLLTALIGCGQAAEPEMIMPASFYYHNNLSEKEDFNNVFVAEVREGSHYQNNYVELLNNYFQGPKSESLVNPFPTGLEVISLTEKEETVHVVLSDEFAKLSNVELTLACSCLSLTMFDLRECNYVRISAESKLLSDQESITIARDSLILSDSTPLPSVN